MLICSGTKHHYSSSANAGSHFLMPLRFPDNLDDVYLQRNNKSINRIQEMDFHLNRILEYLLIHKLTYRQT